MLCSAMARAAVWTALATTHLALAGLGLLWTCDDEQVLGEEMSPAPPLGAAVVPARPCAVWQSAAPAANACTRPRHAHRERIEVPQMCIRVVEWSSRAPIAGLSMVARTVTQHEELLLVPSCGPSAADGLVCFPVPPAGSADFHVCHGDYFAARGCACEVHRWSPVPMVFVWRGGRVTGNLVDGNGRGIGDVRVYLTQWPDDDGEIPTSVLEPGRVEARTLADGVFLLRGVRPGSYDLVAEHPVYARMRVPLAVPAGHDIVHAPRLRLQRQPR
jgi:hypothetical protein